MVRRNYDDRYPKHCSDVVVTSKEPEYEAVVIVKSLADEGLVTYQRATLGISADFR